MDLALPDRSAPAEHQARCHILRHWQAESPDHAWPQDSPSRRRCVEQARPL